MSINVSVPTTHIKHTITLTMSSSQLEDIFLGIQACEVHMMLMISKARQIKWTPNQDASITPHLTLPIPYLIECVHNSTNYISKLQYHVQLNELKRYINKNFKPTLTPYHRFSIPPKPYQKLHRLTAMLQHLNTTS